MGFKILPLTVVLLLATSMSSHAQKFDEWFKQKETQIKYLVEQVVAYRLILSQSKKGYDIMQNGLGSIHGFKSGEFNDHQSYIFSLDAVSPEVRNHQRVEDFVGMQHRFLKEWQTISVFMANNSGLTVPESSYISDIHRQVSRKSGNLSMEFQDVMSNRNLQMTDAERIERIDHLYRDYLKNYLLFKRFNNQIKSLMVSRRHDRNAIQFLEELY
ncbi:hypothetical protein [Fontibacter flavus]|uniref:TerB family tellurite resistance protein n=1 Tax=Fontibacter flavus TaxID=654838 RepID=A0ABV6FV83_9BACT